ncbi:unnamed protein product [Clonostachys solani]|uniref:Protein kinase domain-containing protein n=1 Tax=Clonostachys solani TaxID=160281 RepID=A0A9N9ZKU8_9HYPO|nr:unnamed protein product [Clonostachys solani]
MDQNITTIKENLESLRYSNANYESRYFFPEGSLLDFFSDSTTKSALQSLSIPQHEIPDLVKIILRGAFSLPDDHLPYSEEVLEHIFGVEKIEDALGSRRTHPWIIKFQEKQWEVAVPILKQHILLRKLDDRIIMPYLSEEPVGNGSGGTGSQLVCALTDLSSALAALHNFTSLALEMSLLGCHHDLAPRNILIHNGKLLLADFGLSTLRNLEDSSLTTHKDARGFYNAPECQTIQDERVKSQKVRRSSDVWSFGCILLEVLTYMLRGSDGVSLFKNQRRAEITVGFTWFRFHLGPDAESPAVKSWLEELRREAHEPYQVWMIVLISEMLQLDPGKRPSAERVFTALRAIFILSLAGSVEKGMETIKDGCSQILDQALNQMRYKSWLFAFNKLFESFMNSAGQKESQNMDFIYQTTLEALKEASQVFSGSFEGGVNTSTHQKSSLFRYQLVRLLDALPFQYRSVAKEHLTTSMLTHGEPDIQGELSAAMSQDDDVGTFVVVKRLTALIEEPHLELDRNDIIHLRAVDIHDLSTIEFGPKRVLVEWLVYKGQRADENNRRNLGQRVTSIVNLPHKDAFAQIPGTLPCIGLFHDPSKTAFGVVYELPSLTTNALTLGHLLGLGVYRPPLEDRFRLAKDICERIHTVHKVGWVHCNINPFNVLFFPQEPAIESECAKSPRIFGFAGSRESKLDSITLGPDTNDLRIYQHPNYIHGKTRYREEFDYYSTGLILLEIGLWSTLTTLTKSRTFQGASPMKFREMIIERKVPELRESMGRRYMEATEACLQGEFTLSPLEAEGGGLTSNSSFKTLVIDKIPLID